MPGEGGLFFRAAKSSNLTKSLDDLQHLYCFRHFVIGAKIH